MLKKIENTIKIIIISMTDYGFAFVVNNFSLDSLYFRLYHIIALFYQTSLFPFFQKCQNNKSFS